MDGPGGDESLLGIARRFNGSDMHMLMGSLRSLVYHHIIGEAFPENKG